jgi:hypothetical protein
MDPVLAPLPKRIFAGLGIQRKRPTSRQPLPGCLGNLHGGQLVSKEHQLQACRKFVRPKRSISSTNSIPSFASVGTAPLIVIKKHERLQIAAFYHEMRLSRAF